MTAEPETFDQAVVRLRRRPSPAALTRFRDAVMPGGRIVRVRRLPGGLECGTHAVDLLSPDGERRRLVVRRYTPQQSGDDPERCIREWNTLTLLAGSTVPSPRPILLDADGSIFGTPSIVMTRVPGRSFFGLPSNLEPWLRQLAESLAAIHRIDLAAAEAVITRRFDPAPFERRLAPGSETEERIAALPEGRRIWRELMARLEQFTQSPVVPLHGDFFTGNTIWQRGRLAGIVDWGSVQLGPAQVDLASIRQDLALLGGPEVAGRFLDLYQKAGGADVQDMALWDLRFAWSGALMLDIWFGAVVDAGVSGSTRAEWGERRDEFVLAALARLDDESNSLSDRNPS